MRNNCQTADPVKLGEQDIEDVTEFTYLGAKVTKDGNTEAEIKTRINKARGAFAALKNIWKTKMISKKTKIRIFKSNSQTASCIERSQAARQLAVLNAARQPDS